MKLFLDRINILTFAAVIFLRLRDKQLKVFCSAVPSDKGLFSVLEGYLMRHYDISFVLYDHLDLYGANIPDLLTDNFGALKDDINEKSYIYCEKLFSQRIKYAAAYKNMINFVNGDGRIDAFIKKELLVAYCRKFITLFQVMELLKDNGPEGTDSRAILSGDCLGLWDIYARDSLGLKRQTKIYFRAWFRLADNLSSVFFVPFLIALTVLKNIMRVRLTIKKTIRSKIIWVAPGLTFGFLCNLFRETSSFNSRFSNKDALFIWEGIDAAGSMEKYQRENGVDSVVPGKTAFSAGYFIKEVLINDCLAFLGRLWLGTLTLKGNTFLAKLSYFLAKNITDYDSLCRTHPPKLFFISRYYESRNAIKTIVINRYGGKTVTFQFGNIPHPLQNIFLYAYSCLNHFLLYGEGDGEFQGCGHKIDSFSSIGSDRVDLSVRLKDKRGALREKFGAGDSFIIVVFGPAYNATVARRKNVLKFYNSVVNSFMGIARQDVLLLVKPHQKSGMVEGEMNFPELAELLNGLRSHDKVRFHYNDSPYELMVAADFVVTWSFSTTGIESIATGRKTVFFDPMKSRFQPFRKFHEKLILNEEKELVEILKSALGNAFPIEEGVYESLCRKYCYPNDGLSGQRLLDKMHNFIEGA